MAIHRKIPTFALVAIALIVGMGVAAAAVTIVQTDPNPIAPGEGTVKGSTDLSIDSQSLSYSGVNATGVDVTVMNGGSVDHTGDVHISVKTAGGTVVESKTFTGETFTGNSTASTVSFTFSKERPVDSFADVEVLVEETA